MTRRTIFRSLGLFTGFSALCVAGLVSTGCGDSEVSGTGVSSDSVSGTRGPGTSGPWSTSTTFGSSGVGTSTTGSGGCPIGTPEMCGDSCVDTSSNPEHCGGCYIECDQGDVCSNSTCAQTCSEGLTNCFGACVDTDNNPDFCGGCAPCEEGEVCSQGLCSVTCGGGTTNCDGACVDTTSNPQYCGGCDASCGTGSGWACVDETCVDIRTWAGPVLVESDIAASAQNPQIDMDSTGNAVAVWGQNDATRYNIWANLYDAVGNSWGTEALIETDDVGNAEFPQVGVDDNGYAFSVWYQTDGSRFNIWANRYDVAQTSWGTAELIENDDVANALEPQVAVDGAGNAIAIWRQTVGGTYNIYVNRWDVGDGDWGGAMLIEADDAGNAEVPQIGVDSSGNAVAIWRQNDGSRYNIVANTYDATLDNWGTAGLVESDDAGNANGPQIGVDPDGNAVAVWPQTDGTRFNLWANTYSAATSTWGTAELIETDDVGNAEEPQVAVDPAGNAVAVWRQRDPSRYNIWANSYNAAGDTWSTAVIIETSDVGNANEPAVATDADGNAVAVWHQTDGIRFNVWANRYYVASDTWGTAEIIESDNSGNAETAQVAVDSVGRAVAIWRQTDGLRFNIWANRLQ